MSKKDNALWIPHFGLMPWPRDHIDQEIIRNAESDKTERTFYVAFNLENIDTRKTGDSAVVLSEDRFMQLHNDGRKLLLELKLVKNKDDRLAVIDTRIKANTHYDALRRAYNIISSYLLTIQAFKSAANLSIWAIIIKDDKHNAEWISKPQEIMAQPLQLPEVIGVLSAPKAIFALYREAKNNPSPFYRLFCYFKILGACVITPFNNVK